MTSHCRECNKTVEEGNGEFCSSHSRALSNIQDAYTRWQEAYGKLAFKAYLEQISKLSETGERARELAKFLAQDPERWATSGR